MDWIEYELILYVWIFFSQPYSPNHLQIYYKDSKNNKGWHGGEAKPNLWKQKTLYVNLKLGRVWLYPLQLSEEKVAQVAILTPILFLFTTKLVLKNISLTKCFIFKKIVRNIFVILLTKIWLYNKQLFIQKKKNWKSYLNSTKITIITHFSNSSSQFINLVF